MITPGTARDNIGFQLLDAFPSRYRPAFNAINENHISKHQERDNPVGDSYRQGNSCVSHSCIGIPYQQPIQ